MKTIKRLLYNDYRYFRAQLTVLFRCDWSLENKNTHI